MPIGPIGAADELGEEPRPMPAMTEISRRVSALWHMGHATVSALADVVMASKRPAHSWQTYSCSGIDLDCSPCPPPADRCGPLRLAQRETPARSEDGEIARPPAPRPPSPPLQAL